MGGVAVGEGAMERNRERPYIRVVVVILDLGECIIALRVSVVLVSVRTRDSANIT